MSFYNAGKLLKLLRGDQMSERRVNIPFQGETLHYKYLLSYKKVIILDSGNIYKEHITSGSINSVFKCGTFNFERLLFLLMGFLCPFILKKNPLVLSLMVIVIALFVNVTFISLLFIIWFFFFKLLFQPSPLVIFDHFASMTVKTNLKVSNKHWNILRVNLKLFEAPCSLR